MTVSEDYHATGTSVIAGCYPLGPPVGFIAVGGVEVGIVPKSGGIDSIIVLAESEGGSWTLPDVPKADQRSATLSGSTTIKTPAAYRAVWVVITQVAGVRGLKRNKCVTVELIEGQGFATDLSTQVN